MASLEAYNGAGEIHTMGRNVPVKFNELPVNIMIPCSLSSAYVNTFYMVRNLLNTFISNYYLFSYKMDLQIVKTQTNMGNILALFLKQTEMHG